MRQGTKVFKSLKGITSISDSEFWSPARDAVEEPFFSTDSYSQPLKSRAHRAGLEAKKACTEKGALKKGD